MGVSTLHLVRKMRGEVDYTTNAKILWNWTEWDMAIHQKNDT